MQRRTVLFLSLAAGLAIVVVAVSMWPDGGPPDVPHVPPQPAAPDTAVPAPRHQDPAPAPAGAPLVRVEVTSRERYVPPSPLRVQAVRAGDRVELPTTLLAGAGAGFDAAPTAAGAALVRVAFGSGSVLRHVPLAPNEVARPTIGAPLVVRGKVLGPDSVPVPGARVWFGEFDAAGERREWPLDDEGAYEAQVPAGEGVPFVARAPGHATQYVVIAVAAPTSPWDATLARGCALDVQLAGMAASMERARVFVLPRGAVASGLAHWPFFEQTLRDGYAVDANGHATIDDLPASGEVTVVVHHPLARAPVSQVVLLKGERVRALVPIEFAASAWRGRIVDEAGEPRIGVDVWARYAGGSLEPSASQRFAPPHFETRGAWDRSDANGAFEVAAAGGGTPTLSLRHPHCAGRDIAWSSLRAGEPIVLPAWVGGEPELRLLPPRAGTAWFVECDLGGGGRDAVAADQPWRVSVPYAGAFDVRLTTTVDGRAHGVEQRNGAAVTGTFELHAPWTQ